jgi:lipoprotein Spr
MKKFLLIASCLFFALLSDRATSQAHLTKVQSSKGDNTPNFINDISFTPQGITQKTEIKAYKGTEAVTTKDQKDGSSLIERLTGIQFKYAMMLNVEVESLKNLTLFGFIDNWFGTKYKMGGTSKSGIDCSALTSTLFLAVYGLVIPRTAVEQYKATEHIDKDELKQGDLVFFHTHNGRHHRTVSHVGLYLMNDYFVHASTSHGVTISSLDDDYYSKHFICGGRVD